MIKTVELTGSEMKVEGLDGKNTAIYNKSSAAVYASCSPNIIPDADGVIEVPAGGYRGLNDTCGIVYLLGSGKVELTGTDSSVNFKMPSASASSGGGGGKDSGGMICGRFKVASMNDDPDILCMDDVPIDSESLSTAISELTGANIIKPTIGDMAGKTLLVVDDVGFCINQYTLQFVYKLDGEWTALETVNYMMGGSYSKCYITAFVKEDVIAFGIRGDKNDQRRLSFMFAKADNDEWYTVGVGCLESYIRFSAPHKVYTLWIVSESNISPAVFTSSVYTDDPTIWLAECPTYTYDEGGVHKFKSLYLPNCVLSASFNPDTTPINAEFVGDSGTFINVTNANSSVRGMLMIRKR